MTTDVFGAANGKFQFRWGVWRGAVGEFVKSIEKETEVPDMSRLGGRKNSWNLPAVAMVMRGFDAGCAGQRPLVMGEIFVIMSIKIQKRVRLLARNNTVVTLPLSSSLKFYEFSCLEKETKPRSLKSLVKGKQPDKELLLRLADGDSCKTASDDEAYSRLLSGHLVFLESYRECFLVCIPLRDSEGRDVKNRNPLVVPGYYPIELVTAEGLVDARGHERYEEFLGFFAGNYDVAAVDSASFEELTISGPNDKLYDEIGDIETTESPAKKGVGLSSEITFNSRGRNIALESSITASSPNLRLSESPVNGDRPAFTRHRNRRIVTKDGRRPAVLPSTPVPRSNDQRIFFTENFASSTSTSSSSSSSTLGFQKSERQFATVGRVKKHSMDATSSKIKLTPARSLVDISSLNRYKDYSEKDRQPTDRDDDEEGKKFDLDGTDRTGTWVETRTPRSAIDKKPGRGKTFSQLFSLFKRNRGTKEVGRKDKTPRCVSADLSSPCCRDQPANTAMANIAISADLGPNEGDQTVQPDRPDDGVFPSPPLLHNNNNDYYDTIDSPLIRPFLSLDSKGQAEMSSKHARPLSMSLGDLTSDEPTRDRRETAANRSTSGTSSLLRYSKDDDCEKTCPIMEAESEEYEEVVSPRRRRGDFNTDEEGDNYLDMNSTYVATDAVSLVESPPPPPLQPQSSSSSSLSTSSAPKWTSIEQVPVDLSGLEVKDVCACLELLNLGRHAGRFREEQIDGRLLCSLAEEMLVADLGMNSFESIKLMKFVREGWRPR